MTHALRKHALAAALAATIAAAPLAAQPAFFGEECSLTVAEQVLVAAVTDGGSFDLSDGRHVRLAAIQAPSLALGKSNVADWPLAEEARKALSTLVLSKPVALAFDERSVDRHGHILAHVLIGSPGEWLQQRLVADGFARVETHPDGRACAKPLLVREGEARKAKRGIWANAFYAVRDPTQLQADIGTFQIVEGVVLTVVSRRDRSFLNFGADYRTDFTVTIARRDMKRFARAGIDPAQWGGKKIRVRGWISLLNGPEIELTHPEQVELLD